jgi:hypothetical protein
VVCGRIVSLAWQQRSLSPKIDLEGFHELELFGSKDKCSVLNGVVAGGLRHPDARTDAGSYSDAFPDAIANADTAG